VEDGCPKEIEAWVAEVVFWRREGSDDDVPASILKGEDLVVDESVGDDWIAGKEVGEARAHVQRGSLFHRL
jgi:hypothetical protein